MMTNAKAKNDLVFKELQKSIKPCYNYPISVTLRREYIQTYGRIVVNIGSLNRTTFPAIMLGAEKAEVDSSKVLTTSRVLTVDEKSDFVIVTNNLGDNASMVDLQNDSIPPIGSVSLDTSKIDHTDSHILSGMAASLIIILGVINF
jgi:hypothetical protein